MININNILKELDNKNPNYVIGYLSQEIKNLQTALLEASKHLYDAYNELGYKSRGIYNINAKHAEDIVKNSKQ